MDDDSFVKIKQGYEEFYRSLLKRGRLPMWSTEKGFWNASSSNDIYSAFKKLKLQRFKNFLDIGSGDGKVVLIATLFCKNAHGIEIDDFLHSKAIEMQHLFKISNAIFHNADFFGHDFSKYSVMFVAPDAPMERGLESKLLKEMKGKVIVYGEHFHPRFLTKQDSFLVNDCTIALYGNIK